MIVRNNDQLALVKQLVDERSTVLKRLSGYRFTIRSVVFKGDPDLGSLNWALPKHQLDRIEDSAKAVFRPPTDAARPDRQQQYNNLEWDELRGVFDPDPGASPPTNLGRPPTAK